MKTIWRLVIKIVFAVLAVGHALSVFAQDVQPATMSKFSADWWAKLPPPSEQRRVQEMEKYFRKKNLWEPPPLILSFGDTDTVIHFRREMWTQSLVAPAGSDSKFSFANSKLEYSYKSGNIIRSIVDFSAFRPPLTFIAKKLGM